MKKQVFHITFVVLKLISKKYEVPKWETIATFQEADVVAYSEDQAYKHHAYDIARDRFPHKIKKDDIIKIERFNI